MTAHSTVTKAPTARGARRRTQAERSGETREKLVQAAIECLHRTGYSATTTTMVAEQAGVSRGAMTHQYPTKIELMEAVVRAVYDDDVAEYLRRFEGLSRQEALRALPEVGWNVMSRPSGIAVTEILLASRSDAALAARIRPIYDEIEEDARQRLTRLVEDAGLKDRVNGAAMHRLLVGTMRGLAIQAMFSRTQGEAEAAIGLVRSVIDALLDSRD